MNPLQHIDHSGGGSILPLLIFIFWLVVSIAASSKAKKKKQRELMERERRQASRPNPEPAVSRKPEPDLEASDEGKQPTAMDEFHRQLETILSGGRSKREESPPELEIDAAPRTGAVKESSQETVSLEVKPKQEWASADAKIYSLTAVVEPSIADSAISDEASNGQERSAVSVSFESLDEARRGFVWSEIYGKPKSLRVDA